MTPDDADQDLALRLHGGPEPHHVADVYLESIGHLLRHDGLQLGALRRPDDQVGRHPSLQKADVAFQVGEVMEEAAGNVEAGDALVGDGVLRVAHELAGAPEILGMSRIGPGYGPVQRFGQGIVGPVHCGRGQDGIGAQHVYLHGLLRQPPERGLECELL